MANSPFTPPVPPVPLPHSLRPITPVLGRRGDFVPEIDKQITVALEGETARATVTEVLSRDAAVVVIDSIVIGSKTHGYKQGSIVAVWRQWNGFSEIWEPISDREVREREAIERARRTIEAEREEPKPVAEPVIDVAETRATAAKTGLEAAEKPPHKPPRKQAKTRKPTAALEPPRRSLGPRRSKIRKD